jgi:hypothetical protein
MNEHPTPTTTITAPPTYPPISIPNKKSRHLPLYQDKTRQDKKNQKKKNRLGSACSTLLYSAYNHPLRITYFPNLRLLSMYSAKVVVKQQQAKMR